MFRRHNTDHGDTIEGKSKAIADGGRYRHARRPKPLNAPSDGDEIFVFRFQRAGGFRTITQRISPRTRQHRAGISPIIVWVVRERSIVHAIIVRHYLSRFMYPCWGRERGYPSLRRRGKWSRRYYLNKLSNAGVWRVRYITKRSPQSLRPMLGNSNNGRRAWQKRLALRAGPLPRQRLCRFWRLSSATNVGHATAHKGPPPHFAPSARLWRPPPLPPGRLCRQQCGRFGWTAAPAPRRLISSRLQASDLEPGTGSTTFGHGEMVERL